MKGSEFNIRQSPSVDHVLGDRLSKQNRDSRYGIKSEFDAGSPFISTARCLAVNGFVRQSIEHARRGFNRAQARGVKLPFM